MQTNPLCRTLCLWALPPACLAGPEGEKKGGGVAASRALCRARSPPRGGPEGRLGHPGPALCMHTVLLLRPGRETACPRRLFAPPSLPLLPVGSMTIPANRADYSSICSNLKIKTDKVKIFREQCQAKGIKLLSDLYLSNGFMPFNNFKRNIMFFNTLF